VQNPFNVGAIVRTAAAMSVDHLWLVGATPPLSLPKVQKTALGTQRYPTWTALDHVTTPFDQPPDPGFPVRGASHAARRPCRRK